MFGVGYAEALYGVSYLELLDRIEEGGGEGIYDEELTNAVIKYFKT